MGNLSPCLDTGEGHIEEAREELGILDFYFSSLQFSECSIYPFSRKNVFMAVKKKKIKKGFTIVKAGDTGAGKHRTRIGTAVQPSQRSSEGVIVEHMSELSGYFLHLAPSLSLTSLHTLPTHHPATTTTTSLPHSDTFPQRNTHQQAIDTYSAESQEELWQCRHHTLQGGQGQ